MSIQTRACVAIASVLIGCGGATPPAESPEETTETAASFEEPELHSEESETETADETEQSEESVATAPDFPENASVDEAIAAVPQGAERINVDPDELGEPLRDPDLYEPCKVGSNHFTMRVAVWNGKAVGIDVDTKNQKLADCIKEQIRAIQWPQKVPSLNTVEYAL